MEESTKPTWLCGSKINEVEYARLLRLEKPMIWTDKAFFGVEGRIWDEDSLRQRMYRDISKYINNKVSAQIESMMHTLQMECADTLELEENVIHVANGTYRLKEGFAPMKYICRSRLPVRFDPCLPNPHLWLEFLNQLLEPEDIKTLQEFMGYCLIPTTAAQKMLIITGRGGEGKSRIGYVMRGLLGENMCQGSIAKLEASPFALADLQHKLLMVDDDLRIEKLPSSNTIKTIITAEQPLDLERKGVQSYQGTVYARLMAFGNGSLRAARDNSYGFFRRQIILSAKPKAPDRVDNPYLGRLLLQERDQIFLWCLTGLNRLIEQDYQFTMSRRSRVNLSEAMLEVNPVVSFLRAKRYLIYGEEYCASTNHLYETFCDWCKENGIQPIGKNAFSKALHQEAESLGLRFDYNIPVENNKKARGYRGIAIAQRF